MVSYLQQLPLDLELLQGFQIWVFVPVRCQNTASGGFRDPALDHTAAPLRQRSAIRGVL